MTRIHDDDVTAIRERAAIETVVAAYVTLNRSGSSPKGLCPFHDESSPSFHVNTGRNLYKCYGCGEGGDVIAFVMKIDGLSFREALERLAPIAGLDLRDSAATTDTAAGAQARSKRQRLLDAHTIAQQFYAEHLGKPEGIEGRRFLAERGFDRDAAQMFGVGYSPDGWTTLTNHLKAAGFTDEEIITAGLASAGKSGTPVDRFRGRLMWPIRDATGHVVGFGARKLHAHDSGPKYLNTAETPIYKKSRMLFGLDLARKHIAAGRRAVIVEGYTDVMACHLAGEPTAIATCGTAFGENHVRILRRLLDDAGDTTRGEIIYAFDGDVAGQKAALRAFALDGHFQTRTYAAVEPTGLDPCDLRSAEGDAAVRALIGNRVPLVAFALDTALARHDLATAEGRVNALTAVAPILGSIRDTRLRAEYVSQISRRVGYSPDLIHQAVRRGSRPRPTAPTHDRQQPIGQNGPPAEHAAIRLLVHNGSGTIAGLAEPADWSHPPYKEIAVIVGLATEAGIDITGPAWITALHERATTDAVRDLITSLAVEPVPDDSDTSRHRLTARALCAVAVAGIARRLIALQTQAATPGVTPSRQHELLVEAQRLVQRRQHLAAQQAAL